MSNALEIDTLWEGMPEELRTLNWHTNHPLDNWPVICPYCSAFISSPTLHLSASPECVRQLREAKEKAMEGKSGEGN